MLREIVEAKTEFEFTISKDFWSSIEDVQDYLDDNYTAGTDYKIYIERGDDIANGLDLISSKAKKDKKLLNMLSDIPNQEED